MKFRPHGIILSLFLALGLVFSFSIEAFGTHDKDDMRITAADVAADPSQENMTRFIDHIVDYYEQVRAEFSDDQSALIRQLTIFARDIRREGTYRHGDIYAMGITENFVITNHARYPELIGYEVNPDAGTPLANTFKALLGESNLETTECEDYQHNGQDRVACAKKVVSDLTVDVTNIAGLHHDANLDNLDDAFVEPDCTGLTLDTTAKEVFDTPTDDNLEKYVQSVIRAVQGDVAKIMEEELVAMFGQNPTIVDLLSLAPQPDGQFSANYQILNGKVTTRIQERLFCFGSGNFKHENIYVFIMGADLERSTVIVNGNNFDLNGGNLELEDEELEGEDKTIAGLFNRELAGGTSAYANYRWDDPADPDDGIENWFEMNSVPGTSPKRSYIKVADLYEMVGEVVSRLTGGGVSPSVVADNFPEQPLYIFGSGTYPEEEMTADSGGGGCTVAKAGNASQSRLLNLFLVVSVLFSVVFLKRRA